MVLVSGLMKEMLGFIETVIIKGSPADKFACEVRSRRCAGASDVKFDCSIPRSCRRWFPRYFGVKPKIRIFCISIRLL